jgi:hypothetical protein
VGLSVVGTWLIIGGAVGIVFIVVIELPWVKQ